MKIMKKPKGMGMQTIEEKMGLKAFVPQKGTGFDEEEVESIPLNAPTKVIRNLN